MVSYTKRQVDKISKISKEKNFFICVLSSRVGLGKSTVAKEFVNINKYPYIEINKTYQHTNHLSSISYALRTDTTDFDDLYNRIIIYFNNHDRCGVIFHDIEFYQEELFRFLFTISDYNAHNSKGKTIIFLFVVNNINEQPLLDKYFHQYNKYVEYIDFPKWDNKDLCELFDDEYPNCNCDRKKIEQIADISFSNPQDFISNLEELKRKHIFIRSKMYDDEWELKDFDINLLSSKTSKIVKDRYCKLDEYLKETIQKASIIGSEFDVQTLENPLNVKYAQNLLIQIEDISQLIYRTLPNDLLFCFENAEAYMSINKYVLDKDRKVWNDAIADYFATKIERDYSKLSEQSLDELLRKAAYYFKESGDYENSIAYYMKLISHCFAYSNYSQVILFVEELKKFPNKYLKTEILKIALIYSIKSHEVLNHFENALNEYNEFENLSYPSSNKLLWGTIKKAYYTYSTNKVPNAYKLLSFIKEEETLNLLSPTNVKLYVDGFNLLSAIEETLGNEDYIKHFNYALSLSKKFKLTDSYYNLLRKANSVHRGEIGIKLMTEAYNYFENNDKYKYAQTVHNIGTEYINILNKHESLRYLEKAEGLFREIGSISQVCTINSIAIHKMIFDHNYDYALFLLEGINVNRLDDFDKLAVLNNKATCKRKLGLFSDTENLIYDIERINNKKENKFIWYDECAFLQKAYFYKDIKQYDIALSYFISYVDRNFNIFKANKVSVIQNIVFLSKILKAHIPEKVETLAKAYDLCGMFLFENDLMFSDLMFWE